MTFLLEALLIDLLMLISIPVLVLFVQAVMAFSGFDVARTFRGRRPRVAIVIPAHNEAKGIIKETIACLKAQLLRGDRLLVVADNCSDDTAQIARAAGAEVHERHNTEFRGKGYALDYGVRCLSDAPPEVVLIIDADCLVKEGTIDILARRSIETGRPVQALYLMHAPEGSGVMRRIAEFAWIVKNLVRPLGFYRLDLPCQLMGTGMAFPWPMISKAALASGHIVEDMKLGVDLAKQGTPPLFCPEAEVYSYFPTSVEGVQSQRTRWEHGHISMILSEAPKLLFASIIKGNSMLFALAVDLSVPPIALLVLLVLTMLMMSVLMLILMKAVLPLILVFGVLGILTVAIMLSWWRFGRKVVSARDLLMAIGYVFLKVPLYLKFLVNRQVAWVRSKRNAE